MRLSGPSKGFPTDLGNQADPCKNVKEVIRKDASKKQNTLKLEITEKQHNLIPFYSGVFTKSRLSPQILKK